MQTSSPVLMYHDVVRPGGLTESGFSTVGADHYKLDEPDFRHQMQLLREAGCQSREVDGDDLNPGIVLSFDDGGVGAMLAADILEDFGFIGCFFITTNRVGESKFLNQAQIRELSARGHRIGSHSASHPHKMSDLDFESMREEWRSSIRFLRDCLGSDVTTASVPGGFYRPRVARAAEMEGVATLFTSEPKSSFWHVGNCRVYGRFTIDRETSSASALDLALGRNGKRQVQYLAWNAKKLGKTLAGPLYDRLRKYLLEGNKRGQNRTL